MRDMIKHTIKEEKTYLFAIFVTLIFSGLLTLCDLFLNAIFFIGFTIEYYIYFFSGMFIFIWILTRPENNKMFQPIILYEVEHEVIKPCKK
jgi:uncharacterized membrane protein SpoIIM required for sporulation